MTSPRTPRQWNADSEEPPADVTVLRYEHDLPFQFARRTGDAWTLEAHPDPSTWISKNRESWKYVSDYCAEWGPLSEVLPETPEPPQVGCCTACHGEGGFQGEPCSDCLTTGHAHDGPCTPVPVPAPQSVPAVPVSSTGGKETGEGDEDAQGADEPDYVTVPVTPQYVATRAIANIIDEHFGDDYEAAAWAAAEEIVRQGYAYPRLSSPLSREELGRRVADVCVLWSREDDEREGASATWDALNSHRRELYMRVGEVMFGLGMTFSPAPRSLPDSETEWQLELEDGYVEQLADEKTAREYLRNGFKVTSRPVGPWIEVERDHAASRARRATSERAIPEPTEGQNP